MNPEGTVSFKALMHCGVYALVRLGEVVYVGKTKRVYVRLYTHCNSRGKTNEWYNAKKNQSKGIDFDDVWIWPCMLGQMDALEVALIKQYKPRYNVTHNDKIQEHVKELFKSLTPELPPLEDRPKVYIRRML